MHTEEGFAHVNTERDGLGDFQILPPGVAFAVLVGLLFIAAALIRFGVI